MHKRTPPPLRIDHDDLVVLASAEQIGTARFYLELRRVHHGAYHTGGTFALPANVLAQSQFVQGRGNRKFYISRTRELLRLGLLVRIRPARYVSDVGTRVPARYAFVRREDVSGGGVASNVHVCPRRISDLNVNPGKGEHTP